MNGFSFFLIIASAVLFGYVFGDLLQELGVSRKRAHSWTTVFGLAFIAFFAYFCFPLFTQGAFVFNFEFAGFYSNFDGIFLWYAVGLFAGGATKLAEIFLKEQRATAHASPVHHAPLTTSEEPKAQ